MITKPDLMKEGSDFWDSMVALYEFSLDEALILKMICTELDLIDAMEKDIDLSQMRSLGVRGTLMADPLISEVKSHKSLVTTMMRSLHLPSHAKDNVQRAKNAAETRWANRGAKVA